MGRRIWILVKQTYLEYGRDNCSQLAAAISYYVLFSIIPLAILAVSIAGMVLGGEDVRNKIVDWVLKVIPLNETEGRDAVVRAVDSVKNTSLPVALISLVVTAWTSSAVFSSIRKSLNAVWGVYEHRPFARAKLIDFLQMGLLGLMLLASVALTGFLRAVQQLSAEHFGPLANRSLLWELPSLAIPGMLTFVTFLLLYRLVPAAHPRWRDVWPGAMIATLLFELLKNGFAIYVANFNNFSLIYGSLAGALLFLLFTYLAANVLLVGGEVAHTFQRYHEGALDAEIYPVGPQTPVATRALRAVKGLFVRQ